MWKVALGFVAFAAIALFVIMKGGDKVDMQGESGAHTTSESASAAASAPAAAAKPSVPAASK